MQLWKIVAATTLLSVTVAGGQASAQNADPAIRASKPADSPLDGSAETPSDPTKQYYPPTALQGRREGHAIIQCKVTAEGRLRDCVVLSEDPPGMAFGAAALKMAPLFKLKPQTADGKAVEGATWKTRITFKLAP